MLVSSGQKLSKAITSHDWNDVQAMLREFRNGRLSFGADGSNSPYVASVVWVKNTSANDVEPGDVLGLGNPVTTPTNNANEFKSFLAFEGSIPSTSTPHYGQYAVCQEAARKTDGFCRAVVAGVTFCKLTITHTLDPAAEITNSSTTGLTTGYVGTSRILWKDTGTGSGKWGLIRVGDTLDNFFGKPNATITAGSSGTVNAWKPDFTGSALGPTIPSCYNHASTSLLSTDKVAGVVVAGVAVVAKISC